MVNEEQHIRDSYTVSQLRRLLGEPLDELTVSELVALILDLDEIIHDEDVNTETAIRLLLRRIGGPSILKEYARHLAVNRKRRGESDK